MVAPEFQFGFDPRFARRRHAQWHPHVRRVSVGPGTILGENRPGASKYSLINARGEGIAEKRTYARIFQRRRCVVALSGFYEWRWEDRTKRPFAIHLQVRSVMCVAGVWDRWQPAGEPDPTFARLLPPSWRRVTPKRPRSSTWPRSASPTSSISTTCKTSTARHSHPFTVHAPVRSPESPPR
ncbi:MAG: hypothetical protein CL482_00200 [Acidobacteria bacterium]|nr:hypothetical protein [Acidobacteriota bacterium]